MAATIGSYGASPCGQRRCVPVNMFSRMTGWVPAARRGSMYPFCMVRYLIHRAWRVHPHGPGPPAPSAGGPSAWAWSPWPMEIKCLIMPQGSGVLPAGSGPRRPPAVGPFLMGMVPQRTALFCEGPPSGSGPPIPLHVGGRPPWWVGPLYRIMIVCQRIARDIVSRTAMCTCQDANGTAAPTWARPTIEHTAVSVALHDCLPQLLIRIYFPMRQHARIFTVWM